MFWVPPPISVTFSSGPSPRPRPDIHTAMTSGSSTTTEPTVRLVGSGALHPGQSSLGGDLARLLLPRPAAGDLQLQRETEERPDGHDPGQHGDTLGVGGDRNGPDD